MSDHGLVSVSIVAKGIHLEMAEKYSNKEQRVVQ